MKITNAVRVLQKGVALSNAKTWKKTETATATMSAFLTALASIAVAQGWFDGLDADTIMAVSSLLVTVVFAVLGYLNVATDEEVGLKPKAMKEAEKREQAKKTVNHFLGGAE